jgi:anti-sigma factor ChrR (cupin superfamily)
MLTCKQASQFVSISLDRPLSWSERLQLKVHLLLCNACRRFNQQLQILRAVLRLTRNQIENDSSIQLPADAKTRIEREITSHRL